MTQRRAINNGKPASGSRLLLLLLLLLALPAAGMLWREYPALVRYFKIARM